MASMSSIYSQHRQFQSSNELNKAQGRGLTQSPRESMLAYDSHQQRGGMATPSPMYQRVDRPQAPGLESGRKKLGHPRRDEDSSPNRWFGWSNKPKTQSVDKSKLSLDKLSISAPIPVGPAPTRPPRPPIEQTPASFYNFPALEELYENRKPLPQPPKPPIHYPQQPSPVKPPTIHSDRLGQRHDALRSHPVTPRLEITSDRPPVLRSSSLSAIKQQNRRAVIYPHEEESNKMLREPQLSAGLMAEKRRGRVYTPDDLHKFTDTTSWQKNADKNDEQVSEKEHDQEYVSDEETDKEDEVDVEVEGEEEDSDVRDSSVPTINIVEPEDELPDQTYLKVDHAWKHLYNNERKRVRSLECLVPLAKMIAASEKIESKDVRELYDGLDTIIKDREQLFKLWPLVKSLAKDQDIDVLDFESMGPALESVFADRDKAKHMVNVHKRARSQLERRVKELEEENASLRANYYGEEDGEEEDYIR
ncbi:hypothetical protein F4810DRAFT_720230 [Camillea tinctor]|nr:hypothetical protein F4810DRAFT_720230 [Camillea tinctor]